MYYLTKERDLNSELNTHMREYQDETRLESTRKRIAERIRPVCGGMPEEDFEKMVARMALIEYKHAMESTPTRRMVGEA